MPNKARKLIENEDDDDPKEEMLSARRLNLGEYFHEQRFEAVLVHDALEVLEQFDEAGATRLREQVDGLEDEFADDTETLVNLLDQVFSALSKFCPPYTFFGRSEGDGSSYGCWPDIERLREDVKYGDHVLFVDPDRLLPTEFPEGIKYVWRGEYDELLDRTGRNVWVDYN